MSLIEDGIINIYEEIRVIADIRGADTLNYKKGEKILRCKLATMARLIDIYGWNENAYLTITSRIEKDNFIITLPFGLSCEEVTAGSLVKLDTKGNLIDAGSTDLDVDLEDFLMHVNFHYCIASFNAVVCISSPKTISLSVMKCGLLPLCQEAVILGPISYSEYNTEDLSTALLTNSKILFVRNYGVYIGGDSIEEVFYLTNCLMNAIDIQLNLLPFGLDNLHFTSNETMHIVNDMLKQHPAGDQLKNIWKVADVHFQGLVRLLDNAGYSTGYVRNDSSGKRTVRSHSTTEIAPTSLSISSDGRRSALDRTVTPVSFQRNESAGPSSSKFRSSRWVVETGGLNKPRSSSVRYVNTNKFAPQGKNPKELKQKIKEIRKEYFEDTITSGPQSSVLEGITWEEAKKIKASGNSFGESILVTAASKGIIQRDHQKEALFYKNYTLGNPFENITDHELEKYKEEVELKTKHQKKF